MKTKRDKITKLEQVLARLLFDAERVSKKYGTNESGKPSDWSEWIDLRNAIAKAKELLK